MMTCFKEEKNSEKKSGVKKKKKGDVRDERLSRGTASSSRKFPVKVMQVLQLALLFIVCGCISAWLINLVF